MSRRCCAALRFWDYVIAFATLPTLPTLAILPRSWTDYRQRGSHGGSGELCGPCWRVGGPRRGGQLGVRLFRELGTGSSKRWVWMAQTINFAPGFGPDDISTCLRMKKTALTVIVITIVVIVADVVIVVVLVGPWPCCRLASSKHCRLFLVREPPSCLAREPPTV